MAKVHTFPRHDIDPKLKDDKWILQAVKAAWDESSSFGDNKGFYHNRHRFREYRDYANGNQSVQKYKNAIQPKEANGAFAENFVQLDYTIIPFIPKFRKIALGKIQNFGHSIVASAIDTLARDQEAEYFADLRAKIELAEMMSDVPGIEKMVGLEKEDPHSIEEINIKRQFSWKHSAAMEVENGLDLIFNNNKYDKIAEKIDQDIFDFGVGGCKDYFDENGVIKIKHVKPYQFASSYSEEPDFSDARWMFEVESMTLEDIRRESNFTDDQMLEIASLSGQNKAWDNNYQRPFSRAYDDHKVSVVNFEYKTVDDMVFEKRVNTKGNLDVRLAPYSKKTKPNSTKEYSRTKYQVIYTCKWIVGTDFVYKTGRATNMKRKKNSLTETRFSFHMYAPSQDQMKFFGVVEQMIPVADQLQISWLKLQNLLLNVVPPGIAFDLSALENVNLGHAGEEWKPRKILELYRQRGDMPYRSRTEDGDPMNGAPITPLQNSVMAEASNMLNLINGFMMLLRDNIGFNEVTDGSTPNARMLNGVASMAYESTSNALQHLIVAKKRINVELAEDLTIRMQDAFSSGKVEGYKRALGGNTQKFWEVNTDISVHEIALKIEDRPTQEEIQDYRESLQIAIQSGQITVADKAELETVSNLKERVALLAYRVKKNQELKQQESLMLQQQNGQIQQQSAMVAEEEKRKTLQTEAEIKAYLINLEKQWDMQIEEMKLTGRIQDTSVREQGRIQTKQIENQGKIATTAMNNETKEKANV